MGEALAIKPSSLKNGQVQITGKVTRTRRYERHYYTTLVMPAKDEYSKPSYVEVRSVERIGEVDDKVTAVCELGGYEGKAYQVTDRDTGERKTLVPVNLFLDVVA
jgi:hypothetical protein